MFLHISLSLSAHTWGFTRFPHCLYVLEGASLAVMVCGGKQWRASQIKDDSPMLYSTLLIVSWRQHSSPCYQIEETHSRHVAARIDVEAPDWGLALACSVTLMWKLSTAAQKHNENAKEARTTSTFHFPIHLTNSFMTPHHLLLHYVDKMTRLSMLHFIFF